MHGTVEVLNPGSISLPRRGGASYAVLTLNEGRVECITLHDTQGGLWDPEKKKQKKWGWF